MKVPCSDGKRFPIREVLDVHLSLHLPSRTSAISIVRKQKKFIPLCALVLSTLATKTTEKEKKKKHNDEINLPFFHYLAKLFMAAA